MPIIEHGILFRKLASAGTLGSDEEAALAKLSPSVMTLRANQDIVRQGDRPTRSCLVLSGMVCTSRMIGDGSRQITSLYVPGDTPDLQSVHLEILDMTLTTLGPCRLAFIDHEAIRWACSVFPRLGAAFWKSTLIDAAIYREWVANVGQRPALNRTAHLLCEVVTRLRAVGLANDFTCDFPLTQGDLADCLGTSDVHINRVLQQLRSEALAQLRNKRLSVLDWKGLIELGDFEPDYLHMPRLLATAA